MSRTLREKFREYYFEHGPRRIIRSILRVFIFCGLILQLFLVFGSPFFFNEFNYDVQAGKQKFADLVTDKASIKVKLKPGTDKQYTGQMRKSNYSICYIHGFSASRMEVEPVVSRLAKHLKANLFFTRLAGHGYVDAEVMRDVTAQDWIKDAVECVEVAGRTGDKVVVIGMSMGAALATLVAANTKYKIHTLILLSPYFGVKDQKADFLAGFYGGYIADYYFKGYRSFEPANDKQKEFWTTRYPASVLKPVMMVAMAVRQADLSQIKAPVYVAYSKNDELIDFSKVEKKI